MVENDVLLLFPRVFIVSVRNRLVTTSLLILNGILSYNDEIQREEGHRNTPHHDIVGSFLLDNRHLTINLTPDTGNLIRFSADEEEMRAR